MMSTLLWWMVGLGFAWEAGIVLAVVRYGNRKGGGR